MHINCLCNSYMDFCFIIIFFNREINIELIQLKRQINEWDKRAEEYEVVILKFREKNFNLNEQIQELKDEVKYLNFYFLKIRY